MGIIYDENNSTYTDSSPFDKVKVVPEGKVLYKESNPTRSVYFQGQKTTKHGIAIETENGWHLVDIEEYLNSFGNALDEEKLKLISSIYNLDISKYLQQEQQVEEVPEEKTEEEVSEETTEPEEVKEEQLYEEEKTEEERTEKVTDALEEALSEFKEKEEQLEEVQEQEAEEVSQHELEALEAQKLLEVKAVRDEIFEEIYRLAEEKLRSGDPLKLEDSQEIFENLNEKTREVLKELSEYFTLEELISEANRHLIEDKFDDFIEPFLPNDLSEDKEYNLERLNESYENIKNAILDLKEILTEEDLVKLLNLAESKINELKDTFASTKDLSEEIQEQLIEETIDRLSDLEEVSPYDTFKENLRYLQKSEKLYREHIDSITKYFFGQRFEDLDLDSLMKNIENLGFERTLTSLANIFSAMLALGNDLEPLSIYEALEAMKQFAKRGELYDKIMSLCVSYSLNSEDSERGYTDFLRNYNDTLESCSNKLGKLAFFIESFLPQYETKLTCGYFKYVPTINQFVSYSSNLLRERAERLDIPRIILHPTKRTKLLEGLLQHKKYEYIDQLLEQEAKQEAERKQIEELEKHLTLPAQFKEAHEDISDSISELIQHSPETEVELGQTKVRLPNLALLVGMFDRVDGRLQITEDSNTTKALIGLLYQASTYLDAIKEKYSPLIAGKLDVAEHFERDTFFEAIKILEDSYLCFEGEDKEECDKRLETALLNRVKDSIRNLTFLAKDAKILDPEDIKYDEYGNRVFNDHSEPNKDWEVNSYLDSFLKQIKNLSSSILAYYLYREYRPDIIELSKRLESFKERENISTDIEVYVKEEVEEERGLRTNKVLKEISDIFNGIQTKDDLDLLLYSAPYVSNIAMFMKSVFAAYPKENEELAKSFSFSSAFQEAFNFDTYENYEQAIFDIIKNKVPKEDLSYIFDDFSQNVLVVNTPDFVYEETANLETDVSQEEVFGESVLPTELEEGPVKFSYQDISFEDLDALKENLEENDEILIDYEDNKQVSVKKVSDELVFEFREGENVLAKTSENELRTLSENLQEAIKEVFNVVASASESDILLTESLEELNNTIKNKKKSKGKKTKTRKQKQEEVKEDTTQTESPKEVFTEQDKKKSKKKKEKTSVQEQQEEKENIVENLEQQAKEVVLQEIEKEDAQSIETSLSDQSEFYKEVLESFSSPATISSIANKIAYAEDFDPEIENDIKGLVYLGIYKPENLDKILPYVLNVEGAYNYLDSFKKAYEEDNSFKQLVDASYNLLSEYSSSTKKEALRALANEVLNNSKHPVARVIANTILSRTSEGTYVSDRLKNKIRNKVYRDFLKKLTEVDDYLDLSITDKLKFEAITDSGSLMFAGFKVLDNNGEEHVLAIDDVDNPLLNDNLLIIYAALENDNVLPYVPYLSRILSEDNYEFSLDQFSFGKRTINQNSFYYITGPEGPRFFTKTSDFLAEALSIVDSLRPSLETEKDTIAESEPEENKPTEKEKRQDKKTKGKESKKKNKKPKGKVEVVDANVSQEGTIETVINKTDEYGITTQETVESSPDRVLVDMTNRVLKKLGLPKLPYKDDNQLLENADKVEENMTKEKHRIDESRRLIYYADANSIMDALIEFVYQEKPNEQEIRVSSSDIMSKYSGGKYKEKLISSLLPKILSVYDLGEKEIEELVSALNFPENLEKYRHSINKRNLSTSVIDEYSKIVKQALEKVGIEVVDSFILDEIIKAFVEVAR